MRVLAVSVTERGRALAGRLPYEHVHGNLGPTLRQRWDDFEGLVLMVAVGAAVRVVGPLLADKHTDPAVVCVDDAGRWVVPVVGGHAGANRLAIDVAAVLGATAVVTTATDATGTPALDDIPGWKASGDVAGVTAALLDGRAVGLRRSIDWPLPTSLAGVLGPDDADPRSDPAGGDQPLVVLTDGPDPRRRGIAALHPPSLVAGIGTSTAAPPDEVESLLAAALAGAGLTRASVAEVATIDRRLHEPAVVALGLPIRVFDAAALASVAVPTPSGVVAAAVGTPSVAEAAALLAAGPGATLLVTKTASAHATVAIARRHGPRGHLALVGLGPGDARHRTPAASAAVRSAEVVIGYGPYIDQCAELLSAGQEIVRSPIGDELVRAKLALAEAAAGRRVAMVCSGDSGVFAMASIVLEAAGSDPTLAAGEIEVVPGVTAALAAAAVLGAPLGHDHALISLSDLHTPWAAIAARVQAAAVADLVVAFYNPRSVRRRWQIDEAMRILTEHRPATTPVGIVGDAARADQRVRITTLGDLDPSDVDMTTCVIVGSSTSKVIAGRLVTPRGLDQ